METMRALMLRVLPALVFAALASLGCARQGVAVQSAPASTYPNASYGWPPPSAAPAALVPEAPPFVAGPGAGAPEFEDEPGEDSPIEDAPNAPPRTNPNVPSISARQIVGGSACLAELDSAGIGYKRVEEKRGVDTPIEVTGPLGGVRYSGAGQHLICDCRFALALHKVGPIIRELGVDTMYFSGAYSYRTSRVGKLSLHAYGLALDVHEASAKNQRLNVRDHFARGLGDACAPQSPVLNRLACKLKATGLFRELLTPDYNADHADHLHFGVAPLMTDRPSRPIGAPVRTAESKSKVSKPKATIEKSKPKLPELEPVDPARDEPIVVTDDEPKIADKKSPTKTKPKSTEDKLEPEKKPVAKRRAIPKSTPKRTGKKPTVPVSRFHGPGAPRGGSQLAGNT